MIHWLPSSPDDKKALYQFIIFMTDDMTNCESFGAYFSEIGTVSRKID